MWYMNILLQKLETERDVFIDVIIQLVIESSLRKFCYFCFSE